MSWVTVIWSMIAAACLTMAGMQMLVWCNQRTAWANLLFSLTAVSTAAFAGFEVWMMRAATPAEFGMALRWVHLPTWVIIVSLVGFVRLYLRAGRPWLAWTVCGVRTLALILDFVFTPNLNFRDITALRHISFLGESVAVAKGVPNPWMLVGQLSFLLFVIFVIDAAITVGSRGQWRLAVVIGGSIVFCILSASVESALVLWQVLDWPILACFFFMPVVVAMSYEMSRDVLRAAQLSDDLRESEASARALSGRLINAQEEERRRIARELHDDLNQRLALIAIELEIFGQTPPAQPEAITRRMQGFSEEVKSMASELHRLAHQLHPAKLEQLGLAATIRGFCRELATAHEIAIEFVPRDVPPSLPDNVALCLYRIAQETLQNVIKHSGATGAKVELVASGQELLLVVTDDGCGFDPQATVASPSLGIVGMRERVRMVNGKVSVESCPGEGTRIEVRVPLNS